MAGLVESTGDVRIVEWLCTRVDGFFIKNPKVGRMKSYAVVPATNRVVEGVCGDAFGDRECGGG